MKRNVNLRSVGEVICQNFPITEPEYRVLDQNFGRLAKKAAWELLKKNHKNNHTDEFDDINQELVISLLRAGSYYKRQLYIEECLAVAKKYVTDEFMVIVLHELESLWSNRIRHGANKQKFGFWQEKLLEKIIRCVVPKAERPSKNRTLTVDSKFAHYCKSIAWNDQKRMGRKITREKPIRSSMVSLSEFDYLGTK